MKTDSRSRCLFVIGDHPISPNSTGGIGAVLYSHMELLANCGYKIDLVVLSEAAQPTVFMKYTESQPEVWKQVKEWCASFQIVKIERINRQSAPLKHLLLLFKDFDSYYFPISQKTISALQKIYVDVNPRFIWAEHLNPALVALKSASGYPIIYSHHDWEWRIGWYRGRAEKTKISSSIYYTLLSKKIEENLVRRAAGCVSASATEANQIAARGAKNSGYFPTTYPPIDLSTLNEPSPPARIVHLGGMKTTANRIGLERFLDVALPTIRKNTNTSPEIWVIGTLEGASESLRNRLRRERIICTGFVNDLSTVLRPYDIQIIPWEHNTGTRTRIPLALNYSQALISTKTAAACLPELTDGMNCILVNKLQGMGQKIVSLLSNDTERKRIGKNGRQAFMEHYTREALHPRFNEFIENIAGES